MNLLRIGLSLLFLTIFSTCLGACYVGLPFPRVFPSYGGYQGYGAVSYQGYGYPPFPDYGGYGYGYAQPYMLAPPIMQGPVIGGWRGGYGGWRGGGGGGGYGRFRRW